MKDYRRIHRRLREVVMPQEVYYIKIKKTLETQKMTMFHREDLEDPLFTKV